MIIPDLERLLAKATPGPWKADLDCFDAEPPGHNDTCDTLKTAGEYACSCYHDSLVRALEGLVMPSNQCGMEVGLLAARFPGRIGHLYAPGGQRGPWAEVPYALDNGAWAAFKNGTPWDEKPWLNLLHWAALSGQRPLWVLVPDIVGDRRGTLARWATFSAIVRRFGWRPAFAVQDEMTFRDIPDEECVLFLGGSTKWKRAAIPVWGGAFPGRVHVGRVNAWPRLLASWKAGAVSVDGTGWFHKHSKQAGDLRKFLRETTPAASEARA